MPDFGPVTSVPPENGLLYLMGGPQATVAAQQQDLADRATLRGLSGGLATRDPNAVGTAVTLPNGATAINSLSNLDQSAAATKLAALQFNNTLFTPGGIPPGGSPPPAGGLVPAAATSGTDATGGDVVAPDGLQQAEGKTPATVNAGGYTGLFQFGAPRLAELGMYSPAPGEIATDGKWNGKWGGSFNIPGFPDVKTYADFTRAPDAEEAQRAAFYKHAVDINQAIDNTPGADKFSRAGLFAAAHLGGNGGMRTFVANGGQNTAADSNGSTVGGYYNRFANATPQHLQDAFGHPSTTPPVGHPDRSTVDGPPAAAAPPQPVQVAGPGAPTDGGTADLPVPPIPPDGGAPVDPRVADQQAAVARAAQMGIALPPPVPGTADAYNSSYRSNRLLYGTKDSDAIAQGAAATARAKQAKAQDDENFAKANEQGKPLTIGGTTYYPDLGKHPQPAPGTPDANGTTHYPSTDAATAALGARYPAPPPIANPNGLLAAAPPDAGGPVAAPLNQLARPSVSAPGVPPLAVRPSVAPPAPSAPPSGPVASASAASGASTPGERVVFDKNPMGQYNTKDMVPGFAIATIYHPDGTTTREPKLMPNVPYPGRVTHTDVNGVTTTRVGDKTIAVDDHLAYDVQKENHTADAKDIREIADAGRAAQTDNIRVREMRDILNNITTGPGTETKAALDAWVQKWAPASMTNWTRDSAKLTGPAAVEVFQKLGLMGAGTQERGVLGSRGSLGALQLFQRTNPGAQMLNASNSGILGMRLIANQADADYSQGAQDHFATNEDKFQGRKGYTSLAHYDQQWNAQRNPQVYSASMGALGGQDAKQWASGLSGDEYDRALKVVARADPAAKLSGRTGPIPSVGTVMQGHRFSGGDPGLQANWQTVQ